MVGSHRFVSSRVAVVVVGFLLAAPAAVVAAPAGDPAAVARVTELNRKALAAYSQKDYDTAKDLLRQALQTCADAGLDQHPITARTYIHFGAVAIVGFKEREAGIKQFKKALEIEPDIKLTKSIVTPELQDAFEQAQLAADGSQPATAGGGEQGGQAGGGDNAGGAAAEGGGDNAGASDEEESPRKRAPRARPRRRSSDDDDNSDEGDAGDKGGGFFLGLTLGSGGGLASGSGHLDPSHKLSTGLAPGQLGQIEPQVGYFLNSTTLLSLALRLQYISGTNGEYGCGAGGSSYCNPTTFAFAALARATWFLGDGPFHWTVGGQLGGGYVAHAMSFPQTTCAMDRKTGCVDAVLGGPFLIGPTFGLWYDLSDTIGLMAAVNTELGAPKFTFNFDIDVGLGFRL